MQLSNRRSYEANATNAKNLYCIVIVLNPHTNKMSDTNTKSRQTLRKQNCYSPLSALHCTAMHGRNQTERCACVFATFGVAPHKLYIQAETLSLNQKTYKQSQPSSSTKRPLNIQNQLKKKLWCIDDNNDADDGGKPTMQSSNDFNCMFRSCGFLHIFLFNQNKTQKQNPCA